MIGLSIHEAGSVDYRERFLLQKVGIAIQKFFVVVYTGPFVKPFPTCNLIAKILRMYCMYYCTVPFSGPHRIQYTVPVQCIVPLF